MASSPCLARVGVLAGALVLAACDPRPDQCQPAENSCAGNVANACYRPGPEARSEKHREECGAERTCVLLRTDTGYTKIGPTCARKGAPACSSPGEGACAGTVLSQCLALADGGATWVDTTCEKACVPTGTGRAYCR